MRPSKTVPPRGANRLPGSIWDKSGPPTSSITRPTFPLLGAGAVRSRSEAIGTGTSQSSGLIVLNGFSETVCGRWLDHLPHGYHPVMLQRGTFFLSLVLLGSYDRQAQAIAQSPPS